MPGVTRDLSVMYLSRSVVTPKQCVHRLSYELLEYLPASCEARHPLPFGRGHGMKSRQWVNNLT